MRGSRRFTVSRDRVRIRIFLGLTSQAAKAESVN
jgi:hypothetical protein